MWVRSQDKQLLGQFNYFKIQRNLRKYVICSSSLSDILILGEYETFERATSVLDTLQKQLENSTQLIFEMPN